jgi:imidazolonepropionase-like amidohydrolase
MEPTSNETLLTNLDYVDVSDGILHSGCSIRVKDGRIAEIAKGGLRGTTGTTIDLKGRVVMPGLIDCHVHCSSHLSGPSPCLPSTLSFLGARRVYRMLRRGFTTVRDAGGTDAGLKEAIAKRIVPGPRLFVSGKALSQTGGHGDPRSEFDLFDLCGCGSMSAGFGRVADGPAEFLKAARDELRLGADQIKIVASGGVGSPTGSLDQMQLSDDEIRAVVDEATRAGTYVMAHVYAASGINRLVELGVRTIEHGNLLDEQTAKLMAARGAYLVPNLIAYRSIAQHGQKQGYPAAGLARLGAILDAGTRSIELARAAGVKIAFGTDLVKDPESQSEEFLIRAAFMTPIEIIRSATLIGAEIVRQPGHLGVIAEGAVADLLAVDGNPLSDISLLTKQGQHISFIMKGGQTEKNATDFDPDEHWISKWFVPETPPSA